MLKPLKLEYFKLKRSKIFLIATLLPLFAVFQGRMYVLDNKGIYGIELWEKLFIGSMSQYSSFIFPISITVVMAIITQIEHSNNSWKQILAMPVKRETIYFSKLLIGFIIIFYSICIFSLGMVLTGISLGSVEFIPYNIVIVKPLIAYITALPIMAIQFYLSFRFSHIGIPLAFGAAMALPSMLVANSVRYWIFYPWTYPIVSSMTDVFGTGDKGRIMYGVCFVLFVFIIMIGLLKFRKKDII